MKIISVSEDAKKVLRAVSLSMCVSDCNTVFYGIGGNSLEYLSICDVTHEVNVVLRSKTFDILSPRHIVWNEGFLATTTVNDVRSLISHILIHELPKSAIALTLHFLFEGSRQNGFGQNPNTAFIQYYNLNKPMLPDVELILNGVVSNITNLPISHQILVMCIVCSLLAVELDANPKAKASSIPMSHMVGSVLSSLPSTVILFSIRNMIGLSRFIDTDLDAVVPFDNALRAMSKCLRG